MPISAPTIRGGKTAQQIADLQADQQQRGLITPEAAALNAQLTQTPAYQAYQAILQRPATAFDQQQARAALTATLAPLGASIPDSVIFDPDTGQFRQKNWNEAHSNLSALAYIGLTTGAGLAGGAALGALAGAGGVGVGETGAVTGLTGSGFGTGAGLGYTAIAPTVGEALGAGAAGGIGTLSGTAPVLEGVAAGPGAISAPSVGEALSAGGLTTGGPAGYVGGDVLATEAASTAPGLTALSTGAPAAFAGLPAGVAASGGVPAALAGSAGPGVASTILNSALGGSVASPYGWIGPAIQGVTSVINTNKATNAQETATAEQAAATKYAADLQHQAAEDNLAYLKQQAAYDAQVAESTRSANYGQWAAKQSLLGTVGQALGLPARSIPAYVPLPAASPFAGTATNPATSPAPGGAGTPAAPGAAPSPGATGDPAAAAWWNPQDPKGSVAALFAGAAPTSQAILDKKAEIEAAGGQVSPANAEGITSKIYLPGVGWTRVLDGGVAGGPGGGTGTGWTFVPQGGAATAAAPTAYRYQPVDPLASIQQYFADPANAGGTLKIPTGTLGNVGSYF